MAIKRTLKTDSSFALSSMSDLVFLLLIFFMITSTMISPNALKLLLPKSSSQVQAKPAISVSIQHNNPTLYIDGNLAVSMSSLEPKLIDLLQGREEPTISIHADKAVTIEQIVQVMNIAKRNQWKVILATSPER
ncbi:MAG: ExbD/TolR family protein [Bacteroidales bacterium]